MQDSILKITRVMLTDEGERVKTSSDGRNYITAYFQPQAPNGLLSNARERGRNIWQEGPSGSQGDAIYDAIAKAPVDEQGRLKNPLKVIGSVETIYVKEYFIPNENGKYNDPETQAPANKAETYTSVVFEDENIAALARSQGRVLLGEEEAEQMEHQTEVGELAIDDVQE